MVVIVTQLHVRLMNTTIIQILQINHVIHVPVLLLTVKHVLVPLFVLPVKMDILSKKVLKPLLVLHVHKLDVKHVDLHVQMDVLYVLMQLIKLLSPVDALPTIPFSLMLLIHVLLVILQIKIKLDVKIGQIQL